jgi:inhibitor of cysteine peptidase
MKTKLMLICAVTVISLCLFACSPSGEQVWVEVSCDDFTEEQHISKQVEVNVGDSFTAILCSNPSTGFQWSETATISDQSVLEQTGHKLVPPEGKGGGPPAPGTPGQEEWTFKALKKGTSTVSIKYSRPWEGGEKGVWTFNLTVAVK